MGIGLLILIVVLFKKLRKEKAMKKVIWDKNEVNEVKSPFVVHIAGGGPGGLCVAKALINKGAKVTVHEKSS